MVIAISYIDPNFSIFLRLALYKRVADKFVLIINYENRPNSDYYAINKSTKFLFLSRKLKML